MQPPPRGRQSARPPAIPQAGGVAPVAVAQALAYCARAARGGDAERYRAALLATPPQRGYLMAILAFNGELARTRETVSEPMLGEIRLQWWREGIAGVYCGAPREHPVLLGLAAAVAGRPLARAHFDAIIEARAGDLYDEQIHDLGELVRYAEATAARPAYLMLEALSVSALAAHAAARHVGVAWALLGLLRAVPFHARARRLYLPTGLLAAAHVAPEAVYRGEPPAGLRQVTAEIVAEAARRLHEARALARQIPRAALPVLALAGLADGHLARLRAVGFDPFALPAERPGVGQALRLAWATLSGRF
ncbi:MAG: squalene/phytoene synthase family protein [Alphaproteobacteria bacterium]|nr:squalene/phytoene synthase family protein [Alphaproteobacteria bacterium]